MGHDVQSSITYLKRDDRWLKEKCYTHDYKPPNGFPKTNTIPEEHLAVSIEDVRGKEENFSFVDNGFMLMTLDSKTTPEDFDDETKITSVYLKEVAHAVKTLLKASRVQIYDFVVRKRHPSYPIHDGGYYSHPQPAGIAHIDTTPTQTVKFIQMINPEASEILDGSRYQAVNIWKPLRGPIRDYPLTLCDPRTVDPDHDLQPRDTINLEIVRETFLVHHSANHRWYYVSDQTPQEAWLFLQSDSSETGVTGVPHMSFKNPLTRENDMLRESIEVRALVIYDA